MLFGHIKSVIDAPKVAAAHNAGGGFRGLATAFDLTVLDASTSQDQTFSRGHGACQLLMLHFGMHLLLWSTTDVPNAEPSCIT